jgi:inositol monophosphatase 3
MYNFYQFLFFQYTENLLNYVTTMVCIAIRGQPVVGIIHKPFSDETAWGWAGPGFVSKAVSDDIKKKFGTSDLHKHQDLSKARIIVSRSHAGSVHEVAEKAFGPAVNVTPAGGAGYKAWEVAVGAQDAYVHVTLIKKWDICPGDALLGALGGKMTDLSGEEVDYSGKPAYVKAEGGVLATLHDHQAFLAKLKPAMKTKK